MNFSFYAPKSSKKSSLRGPSRSFDFLKSRINPC
nr:MAG TPA: hypothetical protein [Caudoviricetes sp.]